MIKIKPKPLMMKHVEKEKDDGTNDEGVSQSGSQMENLGASHPEEQKKDQKAKDQTSEHSQLTSSLMESSEDESKKRKEQEKDNKKKKGFSEKDLDRIIDVSIKETKTITLMNIPSTVVNHDSAEHVTAS